MLLVVGMKKRKMSEKYVRKPIWKASLHVFVCLEDGETKFMIYSFTMEEKSCDLISLEIYNALVLQEPISL
jgi:hypothetical protein